MLVPFMANSQGVTSSSISGKVLGSDGKGAIGAVVVAIHIPSNSKYGGRTSSDGTYNINGLRVGGPYTIKASIVGSGEDEKQNVFLKLGSNGINFKLNEKQNALSEVVVSAKSQAARGKTGSETSISNEQIMSMPTLSRSFNDFTRLTPEANLNNANEGISINGANISVRLLAGFLTSKAMAIFVGIAGMGVLGLVKNFITLLDTFLLLGTKNGIISKLATSKNDEYNKNYVSTSQPLSFKLE
jgi:hypothetical protein